MHVVLKNFTHGPEVFVNAECIIFILSALLDAKRTSTLLKMMFVCLALELHSVRRHAPYPPIMFIIA